MGKIKPKSKKDIVKDKKKKLGAGHVLSKSSKLYATPEVFLAQAAESLQLGDAEVALPLAIQALNAFDDGSLNSLPALNLCGEIHIELGDIDSARDCFRKAALIDDKGEISEDNGGGPEKFLWLAQISEEGGHDSVHWFEKGALILRKQIQTLIDNAPKTRGEQGQNNKVAEKKRKLAGALCSIIEVYMTDLSWEENAEQKCETLITEATLVSPECAEPWQTLANVRLSQNRVDDARAALKRSLDLWRDLPSLDPKVPEYPTRVSLARLLMEAGMDTDSMEVLENLVAEDDSSVEVWYLGGWCLYIIGEKQHNNDQVNKENDEKRDWRKTWILSRQWLKQALALFQQQSYEDERLGEHTREILVTLNSQLGEDAADEIEDDADEWSDLEGSEEDEVMADV
ncbi:putative assembly chaperone of rpl4 [Erysiphe neolycopersici]|uniref:Putative assembly chaperone of rpl4 n=1 Tax=Erysiphe neolycopersici TaxID=212602 RepID=A0A420HHU0_9PEZI|nr:putative assembly chaperone of rpl4 [Erysiphe neolycopersici]